MNWGYSSLVWAEVKWGEMCEGAYTMGRQVDGWQEASVTFVFLTKRTEWLNSAGAVRGGVTTRTCAFTSLPCQSEGLSGTPTCYTAGGAHSRPRAPPHFALIFTCLCPQLTCPSPLLHPRLIFLHPRDPITTHFSLFIYEKRKLVVHWMTRYVWINGT